MEWTVLGADIYDTAPEQANVILRYLLGTSVRACYSSFFGGVCDYLLASESSGLKVAEGSTWHVCSSTCCGRNWLLSTRLRSARRNTWIIANFSFFETLERATEFLELEALHVSRATRAGSMGYACLFSDFYAWFSQT